MNQSYRANREHRKPPRGGMVNLVKQAEEEKAEELQELLDELMEVEDE